MEIDWVLLGLGALVVVVTAVAVGLVFAVPSQQRKPAVTGITIGLTIGLVYVIWDLM